MERLDYKRLGDYIEQVDVRNTDDVFGEEDVRGISTNKCFMPTKGNLIGVTFTNYKVVSAGQFAFNINTARMGDRFAIALREGTPCIVSSIYVVFQTKEGLLPDYLYIWFLRPEFDRYMLFKTYGSTTLFFNLDNMCELEIRLPDISVQRKYVAIYQAMIANQQSYERGLEDLKLVCDGYIEDLRKKMSCKNIGNYISEINNRNIDLANINVQGVNSSSRFTETKANTKG